MTAQLPDEIVYRGSRYALFANPLEAYFSAANPRPAFLMLSTANRRGYIAEWEIADDRLFLVALTGKVRLESMPIPSEGGARHPHWHAGDCGDGPFFLTDLFPQGGPVPADWYTGVLKLPVGRMAKYVHAHYASRYESYIFLTITQGRLTNVEQIDGAAYHRDEDERARQSWERFVATLK